MCRDLCRRRRQTRRCFQSAALGWLTDRAGWENWARVDVVEATRDLGGQISVERRYPLSSLAVDAVLFARAARSHRAIENHLYWGLDAVMGEDPSRARPGFAAADPGVARRLALNLLRPDPNPTLATRRKQRQAAFATTYLAGLLKF